ncbi:MAG: phosphoribosyltransferase [Candidatus Bathyarchaeia archaeon]
MALDVAFEAPTWDHIYELCLALADSIRESGFQPDILVGVARGGWVPARVLSDLLENPNLANVKVEFYLDVYKTAQAPLITQEVSVPVAGKHVLVVDDVADSGRSLKLVKESLLAKGASDVRIACIYYKPWSVVKPDFYGKETNSWIIFPHETKETVRKIAAKLTRRGLSLPQVQSELVRIGLKPALVEKFLKEIYGGG